MQARLAGAAGRKRSCTAHRCADRAGVARLGIRSGRVRLAGQRARLLPRQLGQPHADRHDRAVRRKRPPAMRASSRPVSAPASPSSRLTISAIERDAGCAGAGQFGRPRGHFRQPAARGDGAGARHQGGVDQLHPIGGDANGAGLAWIRWRGSRSFPALPGLPADHEGGRAALRAACPRALPERRWRHRELERTCSRVSDVIVYASGAEEVTGRSCGPACPAIEYRHAPDGRYREVIVPIIRAAGGLPPPASEDAVRMASMDE